MAKNNNNYFSDMIRRFGENWIVAVRPEDIQRSAKRIFKELVKGQINHETHGKYFLDQKFIDNLIIAARNELEINILYFNALNFYFSYFPAVPNLSQEVKHMQVLCDIYNVIYSKLGILKQTGNIGVLLEISTLCYSNRAHLN